MKETEITNSSTETEGLKLDRKITQFFSYANDEFVGIQKNISIKLG